MLPTRDYASKYWVIRSNYRRPWLERQEVKDILAIGALLTLIAMNLVLVAL
jgi:hypothetical protein